MMLETDKYIVPIFNLDNTDGIGFFVGNYFVTAGHVVLTGSPFIFFKGKQYWLEKEKALLLKTLGSESTFENGLDIAVFYIEAIDSPLGFSNIPVSVGTELTSRCSFRHYSEEFGEAWSVECIPGRLSEDLGNFFKCDLTKILHEGSSGSPIFLDDKIVGVLCGYYPYDLENRILYLKTTAFIRLLEQ